ncbi:MAG: tetratricopeptide repeat protein [Sedimentisphaerales bacterium]|jgi:tetratricopeptide (TPR) repeat protein
MQKILKKYQSVLICIVLAGACFGVFWQVRNFEFTNYDDYAYITENPHFSHGLNRDDIIWAFTTPNIGNWLPLTWLSLMLDSQLFGLDPGRMHLVNLLWHIANTLLLFAILKKMTGSLWRSAFVAAAFALHPMHVESVAWVIERKDVLSTFFFMLTVAAYAGYVRSGGLFRYLLTILLFVFGLLAKPMLIMLPFVLLLLDYWPLERIRRQRTEDRRQRAEDSSQKLSVLRLIAEKVPFFALAVIWSVITFLAQRGSGSVSGISKLPLIYRIANSFLSYARYIGKMFWPHNLSAFYPLDIVSVPIWRIALCVLLVLVITIFVVRFGRKQRYLPVGWFWFAVTLIPVIGIVQSGAQGYADRYTYIPYIGLFIVIAWGLPELLSKWRYRKIGLSIAAAVVLTALGIVAFKQTGYWKNSYILFTHSIEVTQNNFIAYSCLGKNFYDHGEIALAIEQYKKALKITPHDWKILDNLGGVLANNGNFEEAKEYLRQAIKIKPDFANPYNSMGFIMRKQNNNRQAIEYLYTAIKLKPDLAGAYSNLGLAMQTEGNYDEAIKNLSRAVQLQPDEIKPRNDLANALILSGRINDAVEQLRGTIKMRPDSAASLNSLALLIANHPEIKGRDLNEGIRLARRACELTDNHDAIYLKTLAVVYSSAGRFSDAGDIAEAALNIDPNLVSAHKALEVALLAGGQFKKAVVHMKRFLEIDPNNIDTKNNLAWILATSPDPNIRNPSEAIGLAQEACNAVKFKDPTALDTLAAAYASKGRFADAVETATKAINLAEDVNQPQLKSAIQEHLGFYTQGKSYIDPAQKSFSDSNKP